MIDNLVPFRDIRSTSPSEPTHEDRMVADLVSNILERLVRPDQVAGWLESRMIPDIAHNSPPHIALFVALAHKFASLSFQDGRFLRDLFFNTDTYVGGGLSVGIADVEELDNWYQVSTFLRYYPLHNELDTIWVKDYLENAGLMRRLIELGYLKDLHEEVQVGFGIYRKAVYLGRKDYSARVVNEYTNAIAEKLGIRG